MKLIITINNTYILDMNLGIFSKYLFKNTFSKINKIPKYTPHKMKFHAAPCHNPVNNHTIKIFLNHFALLTRFPPNGM